MGDERKNGVFIFTVIAFIFYVIVFPRFQGTYLLQVICVGLAWPDLLPLRCVATSPCTHIFDCDDRVTLTL